MDYSAIIKALLVQADLIDRAIAQLESLNSPDGSADRALNRFVVSIKRAWARQSISSRDQLGFVGANAPGSSKRGKSILAAAGTARSDRLAERAPS